ncbi:MAG: dTMP kinase [Planctomycetes bacterium]|jgi:dTMP kinase|nr:dTMP kinase [Planctomycetota bacterium]MBT4029681.1 dTMP kinase [Planctomycetota bacterium]MBT4561181.1 dTMP kinase [Planctomycetota bacterium]MBT7319545.1 dTMP kinase [Planctomycetota bacterium]
MRGRFLVIEGVDGSGKSTLARHLVEQLAAAGHEPLHIREPGTTQIGERVRDLLLASDREPMDSRSEALLFFTSRNELLRKEIEPALAAGRPVICERFTPSTLAYQGQEDASAEFILALDQLVVAPEVQPDLVLILDLEPSVSLARAETRSTPDAFEARGIGFLEAVRAGYLKYAAARPELTALMDVHDSSPSEVLEQALEHLKALNLP